jgi:hypothetical protein
MLPGSAPDIPRHPTTTRVIGTRPPIRAPCVGHRHTACRGYAPLPDVVPPARRRSLETLTMSDPITPADASGLTEAPSGIEATIALYLDGLYEGDTHKLARAFHPCAALHSLAADGTVTVLPRAQWLEVVKARPSPKSRELPRHDRILSVDLAGDTLACVKLNCAIPPRFFTDFLLLLKTSDGWCIVQKAFCTELRE